MQTDPRRPYVVLVGPPGAGKSTIGRKLARELGVDLYDTDAGIEQEAGRTIPEIFAEDGEPEFRRIEERVVRRAVLTHKGVVSLGGGAVLSAATRELLRERTVVYLEISVAEGLRRTGANSNRPLLVGDDPGAKYRSLMRERRPLYREVASVRVRTDGRSPGRVVRNILAKLGLEPVETAPVDPPARPEGEGTSRRSRSRRRRRNRSAKNSTGDTATANSPSKGDPAPANSSGKQGTAPANSSDKRDTVPANSSGKRDTAATTSSDKRDSVDTPSEDAAHPNPAAQESDSPATEQGTKRRSRRSRRGGRRRSRGAATTQTAPSPEHEPSQRHSPPEAGTTGVGQPAAGTPETAQPIGRSATETPNRASAGPHGSSTGSGPGSTRTAAVAATAGTPAARDGRDPARRSRRRTATRASGAPGAAIPSKTAEASHESAVPTNTTDASHEPTIPTNTTDASHEPTIPANTTDASREPAIAAKTAEGESSAAQPVSPTTTGTHVEAGQGGGRSRRRSASRLAGPPGAGAEPASRAGHPGEHTPRALAESEQQA
ncbi:shikimate kinase [Nocardia transvalensis]|uniref:Shikimate kinase n=1 Tax=Nocardia transvalensis TaxID=37333 RepID=A0A7W9PH28_9NOCA|nr:shikimate kinase [Nocardia transvalensis]